MTYKNKNFKRKKPFAKRKPENKEMFIGTVQGSDRGFAFIIPKDDKFEHDFFVPRNAVNGAYDGDTVIAYHVSGTKDEASILKILQRGNKQIIGTIECDRRAGHLIPDNPRLPQVYIPLSLLGGAKTGQKAVCQITSYPKGKAPGGKVVEILGEEGDLECEELSIIRAFELAEEFPPSVLDEARKAAAEQVLLNGREDFRDKLIFTIDGEDTRDIDDGVSLERVNGNFVLGVHIADVSHYVKFGSVLDKDAYSRGTSVYFPDRVLPMLPKELSNGACSLNEGEDRYAMSCIMTFNADGERLDYKICESVIRSKHRTTYPEITAICEIDPLICAKYRDLVDVVKDMETLCIALEKRRERAGEVSLDVKEAHIYVDENGEIIIPDCKRTISQRMIEQFMISANEAVAEFLEKRKLPCLYRIHESPAPEKAAEFYSFVRDLGLKVYGTESVTPKDFQNVLKAAEDKPYYSVINKVMLRSMQKARYSDENVGHFGLASTCYCHFTSPIRRYPDLFVHRTLKEILHGENGRLLNLYRKTANQAGIDCSERERIADEAERKVDDLYKLAYMSERIGEKYPAMISGVTAFGVFCELENSIEGLVPIEDLPADEYEFYEEKYLLKGKKHSYKLGDEVKILVVDCDLGKMKTLFKIIG